MDKSSICNSKAREAMGKLNEMDSQIRSAGSDAANRMKRGMNKMKDKALSPIDETANKIDEINQSMENINDKVAKEGVKSVPSMTDSAKDIANCLGVDVSESNVGDASKALPEVPNGNPAEAMQSIAESAVKEASKSIRDTLDGPLADAAEAASELENAVPTDTIDSVLNAVECLADCPGEQGLPTHTEIEEKLNNAGLDVNGKIDYSSPKMNDVNPSEGLKNQTNTLKDGLNKVKKSTSDATKLI